MISYLGSLDQFSPAVGRAGHCRQTSLCVGSTPRVPATLGLPRTGVSVLSPSTLLRLPAALYGAGPVLRAVPVFGSSTKARVRLRLRFVSSRPEQLRQPEAWAPAPRVRCAFSLRGERLRQPEAWAPSPRVRCAFSLRSEWPGPGGVPAACVCSQKLASSRDPPGSGCRPSRISGSL